ncbi:MAG: HDIG domain-containing protein [Chloroflexi bacterium]|nr:HDIG domain-containing protein [Chloroflexota bacterium]
MWSPNTRSSQSNKRQAWRNTRVWLLGVLFVLATAVILIVPLSTSGQVALDEGNVAPEDVRAPRAARYVSEVLTELAREEAERNVAVQYDPIDPRVARQQIAYARQVLDFIRAVRLDTQATRDQKRAALAVIENVTLTPAVIEALLDLSGEAWQRVSQEIITVIDLTLRNVIRDVNVAEFKSRLPALVAIDLNEDRTRLVSEVAQNFIVPNRARNDPATEQARAEARSKVEPRQRDIEAGQTIVRQGEVVTPLQIEALNQLNLRQSQLGWGDVGGSLWIAVAVAVLLGLYLWRFEVELLDRPRHLLLLLLLLTLFLLVAKFMVPNRTVLPYVFPVAALSMLLTVLLGPGLAVTTTILLAGLIGVLAGGSLEISMYMVAGGLISVLSLGRVERLNTFFLAGLNVALINAVILLAFRLPEGGTDPIGWVTLIGATLLNGGLSASLTLGGFFLIGNLFDITTTLQLLELARPTHPLLNELLRQSPGTYHHTLMVANLAEQAADRIGANALLTRVGAFYHDIGKTARPYMFVENQVEGANVHDQLNSRTSAEIIVSHVNDGVELARRYRLPSRVRAFIPEHHGTMRVSFLYQKAVDESPTGAAGVDEKAFRYPGPKPQSKETALLMLADGCEATVRATRPASPEELNEIVRKTIADRIAWGQLDECPLTLADLDTIRQSFAATLQGMFHPRLRYPGQEAKSDTGRLRGNGPTSAKPDGETERRSDGEKTDQI